MEETSDISTSDQSLSSQQQIVADQHFVPQFYLRRFANGEGLLERFDLNSKTVLATPKSPKAECQDCFFYALKTGEEDEVSQVVEDFWKAIEDFVSPHLKLIEDKLIRGKELGIEDIDVLAHLGAMLWMRTPMFREVMNSNMARFEKQIRQMEARFDGFNERFIETAAKQGKEVTEEQAEKVRQFLLKGDYDLTFNNNAMHLNALGEFYGFRNMFGNGKWRFHITTGPRPFVTSTSPCIEVWPEQTMFYGPGFYQRKKFFPLSPKVLVELLPPTAPGKKIKRGVVTQDQVLEYNMQQVHWSFIPGNRHSRGYSSSKKELEELLPPLMRMKAGAALVHLDLEYKRLGL